MIPDIKYLSSILLTNNTNQETIENTLHEINRYFGEITNLSSYSTEVKYLAAVPTASGMALSLTHAAQCLLDYKRTVRFLRGIVTAIKDKQKEHPEKVITIFYAGCGPYAPFITLVAPLFDPSEVQFSILEINKDSLELAKKLIETLHLKQYVQEYYIADAVTFNIPSADSFHILFSETLDALLYRESYVPILRNMLPQLSEKAIIIPENVLLTSSFRIQEENISANEPESKKIELVEIFNTRKALASLDKNSDPVQFPSISLHLEPTIAYKSLLIDTKVNIYKDLQLTRGESSLTLPYEMKLNTPLEFKTILFTYQLQPQVELKCEFQ